MSCVIAQNVSVKLSDRNVIDNIDMQIDPGELIGRIGPNGAGKSTLIKGIAGLLPFTGNIEVLGEKVRQDNHRNLSKLISYIPQAREVHWPLTVRRVVSLGRMPHLQPWQKLNTRDEGIIYRAMREVDVYHLRDRVIDELAGGERALVLLARGLATEPSLILADEPVAGLDPGHQIQVMELLKKRAGSGSGVLVVLHDLGLASRFCHKIYMIHEGKMIASGNPKDVLTPENLKKSYSIEAYVNDYEGDFYVLPWRQL